MTGKQKKPAEQQPAEKPQPRQQEQSDTPTDDFSTSFAQTDPPSVQE